jgi:tetratricopeptide (TPR) repeat protein
VRHSLAYHLLIVILVGCTQSSAERNTAGNSDLAAGNAEAALLDYQAAQALAPDQPEPYLNAASAYAALDDIHRAQQAMDLVTTSVDPRKIAQAYYNLGNIYFMHERYDLAVDSYQEALLRMPDDADARYNLELALQRLMPTPPPANSATPTPQQPDGDLAATATATSSPEPDGWAGLQAAQPMTESEAQALLDSLGSSFQPLSLTMTPAPGESVEQDW